MPTKASRWSEFTHASLPVRFRYPTTTPQNQLVSIKQEEKPEKYRAHFTTQDRVEVYFEVGVYFDLPAQHAFQELVMGQKTISPAVVVSELHPIEWVNRETFQAELRWPDRRRILYFIPLGKDLLRIILNPDSELNLQILDTVRFATMDETE